MKDETKEMLEVMTSMHEKVMGKLTVLESGVEVLQSDVGTLKSDVAGMKIDIMQNTTNIAQAETRLFDQISAVHKDLSARLDNHAGFAKEIGHVLGRVKFIEDHLGLQAA